MGCKHTFIFRCDGTQETGLGHVSRCIALAEAFQDQGCVSLFYGNYTGAAAEMINHAGFNFKDIQIETGGTVDSHEILKHIIEYHADGIIVDSYVIDNPYLDTIEQQGTPVILIDDFKKLHSYKYTAIINFTVNAENLKYPCENRVCMLGPAYFLARRRLRSLRSEFKIRDSVDLPENVLVAMGGVDPENLSAKVLDSLLDVVPRVKVKVVVGSGFGHREMLMRLVEKFENGSSVVEQRSDLAEQFFWCDICVCAGGLTKYEAAYLGIPALVLSQNEEQAQETVYFSEMGLVFDMGLAKNSDKSTRTTEIENLLHDSERRNMLSQAGLAAFPSDPTSNVARKLVNIVNGVSN